MEMNTYETPSLQMLELYSEAVLCASATFEDWNEEEFDWGTKQSLNWDE